MVLLKLQAGEPGSYPAVGSQDQDGVRLTCFSEQMGFLFAQCPLSHTSNRLIKGGRTKADPAGPAWHRDDGLISASAPGRLFPRTPCPGGSLREPV